MIQKSKLISNKLHNEKLLRDLLKRLQANYNIILVLSIIIIGVVILIATKAATPTASIEAENGSRTTNVNNLTSSSASVGSFSKFGTPAVSTGVPVLKVGAGANAGKFVDGNNNAIQLRGVGIPGLEIGCANQSPGTIMQTDNGSANFLLHPTTYMNSYNAIAASLLAWDNPGTPITGPHAINTVRLPLNEECFLGINQAASGYPTATASGRTAAEYAAVSGANYQQYLKGLVDVLTNQYHIYVILDLHIAADGNTFTDAYQSPYGYVQPGAPMDHSIAFWDQLSKMFNASNGYPNVGYDIINEPFIKCEPGVAPNGNGCTGSPNTFSGFAWEDKMLRDGGSMLLTTNDDWYATAGRAGTSIPLAGTQNILNKIRANGATNVAMFETQYGGSPPGLQYFSAFLPKDTLTPAQEAVSFHDYHSFGGDIADPGNRQAFVTWPIANGSDENGNQNPAYNIEGHYPIFVGETGDFYNNAPSGWMTTTSSVMNQYGWSYLGYGWTTVQGANNLLNAPLANGVASAGRAAELKAALQKDQGKAIGTP